MQVNRVGCIHTLQIDNIDNNDRRQLHNSSNKCSRLRDIDKKVHNSTIKIPLMKYRIKTTISNTKKMGQ